MQTLLEENDHEVQQNLDVYLGIPDDIGEDTEEDSDSSDDEHIGDVNRLCREILQQDCEVRARKQNDFDEEDLVPLAQLFPKSRSSSHQTCEARPNEQDDFDEEDLIPLADLVTKPGSSISQGNFSAAKRRKLYEWNADPPTFAINNNCVPREPSQEAKVAQNPVDFFKLFFDEDLMSKIVEETNTYGQQKNKELNFTKEELYVLLGGMLLSGYVKYPNKRMFWNPTEDIPKIFKNSMRLNRFEMLLRHIHFNDNANIDRSDRLFKIRPLLNSLNENFKKHGGLDEHLSIDESMIPYYGKHYAKQYIKGKPIRFGFKNWALCSTNGYMISFEIYTGKSNTVEKVFGLGGDVVMSLLHQSEVPPNHGHTFFLIIILPA